MTIDWWTLGLQTVNFIVLVWILARFLFRPVSRIIAERQAAAHAALDAAQAAKADAKAAQEAARAGSDAIAAERARLIAEARTEAEAEKHRLLAEAGIEAEKARAAAQAELDKLRASQEHALARQAGVFAADIAQRLLARLPDNARIAGFIDGLADAVGELPEATRAGIGAEGAVQLRAARELTNAERHLLKQRLADVLKRDVDLVVEPDPRLIAGIELEAPDAIVSNHFRADLDRILAELSEND